MSRSWKQSVVMLACGLVLAGIAAATGRYLLGAIEVVGFVVLAVLVSPLVFPRSLGAAEAQRRSAVDGQPVIYWRPGCPFCLRLRARLGRHSGRAHWVNIWNDPAGAAELRAITGGDETVPTAVLGAESVVNPKPAWLRSRLT